MPVCPACGNVLSVQDNSFDLEIPVIIAGCSRCDWWTGVCKSREEALEKVQNFLEKFPRILRVAVGDVLEYVKDNGNSPIWRGKVIQRSEGRNVASVLVENLDVPRRDVVSAYNVAAYPWEIKEREEWEKLYGDTGK